ncbi:hypothetical protein ACE6H2_022018 [Prunus campanulata]
MIVRGEGRSEEEGCMGWAGYWAQLEGLGPAKAWAGNHLSYHICFGVGDDKIARSISSFTTSYIKINFK